ncbi:MAG TPA: RagB/SusD family nutrient uptake outer membrane protein [Puia sp.]|nr:RagB/SusD family nutrient uptake outer membrane protein [Puia sp.]
MTSKHRYIALAGLIALTIGWASCTKLDEKDYSNFVTASYYNNETEVLSAVLRPYTHTNAWITSSGQVGYWRVSELAGDQLAWPIKGVDGQDNGNWIRLHYHTWVIDDQDIVLNPWVLMYTGVGYCNDPIANLEQRTAAQMGISEDERVEYIAELHLLRAFYYLKLMDLYGNIPIVTEVGTPINPPTKPRDSVFQFCESEILAYKDQVPILSPSMVGRMSKAGAFAMLAELYLNAEKWTGHQRYNDCVAVCDSLINSTAGSQTGGAMALDSNLDMTYSNTNEQSQEIIFSIAYDFQKSTFRCNFNSDFYHFNEQYIYDGTENGNNGVVLIPGTYDKFDNRDLRKKDWFYIGPMYYLSATENAPDTTKPVLGYREYSGKPLVFVDNIRKNITLAPGQNPNTLPSDMTTGEENSGVRFNKYKPGRKSDPHYFSNDWAVYRLSWIYFAKAEALMRLNGGTATQPAVDLINAVRKRAFSTADWPSVMYTTANLTMSELLDERGREFIFEGWRRQDIIRFGTFSTGTWWDHKPDNDTTRQLFPIPLTTISNNPNLKQNPGY